VDSEGEVEEESHHNEFLSVKKQKMEDSAFSSFLGGESYHFGLEEPLMIFN
jgi:hypothetical protein